MKTVLTLRSTQLAVLRDVAPSSFEDQIVATCSTEYPQKVRELGEEGLRLHVRESMGLGIKHGVSLVPDLVTLIGWTLNFGHRFEGCPEGAWGLEILEDPAVPGPLKIELIQERFDALTGGRTVVDHED